MSKPPRRSYGTDRILNEFANDVFLALSNGISFQDNIYGGVKDVQYISTSLPVKVENSHRSIPIGIWVLRASEVGGDGVFTSGNSVTWTMDSGGDISVTDIDGLTAGVLYRVKLAIIAG